MTIKINDQVEVLDAAIKGSVVAVSGALITIVTDSGFEMQFDASELIVVHQDDWINHQLFSKVSLKEALSDKQNPRRKQLPKQRSKERYQPTMEVDLHIHKLVNNTKGMQNHDMLNLQLETAKRQLEFAIRKNIQKVVFIHGVGQGVLKLELEYLFKRYDSIKFYDANYQKYGQGATEVYIYQNNA